jgi:hypothetical protein
VFITLSGTLLKKIAGNAPTPVANPANVDAKIPCSITVMVYPLYSFFLFEFNRISSCGIINCKALLNDMFIKMYYSILNQEKFCVNENQMKSRILFLTN